jgi:hypothetical protein
MMKPDDLKKLIAGASRSTQSLNPSLVAGLPSAEPQQSPVPALAIHSQTEKRRPFCRHIRITARRVRLQDPDNAVVKFIIDGLRKAGVIEDDTASHITLEVTQEKVSQFAKQGTLIEVT